MGLPKVYMDRRRVNDFLEDEFQVVYKGPKEKAPGNGWQIHSKAHFQKRWADSLNKKSGVRGCEKVVERLGHFKVKGRPVARLHQIPVVEKHGAALELSWRLNDTDGLEKGFSHRGRP